MERAELQVEVRLARACERATASRHVSLGLTQARDDALEETEQVLPCVGKRLDDLESCEEVGRFEVGSLCAKLASDHHKVVGDDGSAWPQAPPGQTYW